MHVHGEPVVADGDGETVEDVSVDVETLGIVLIICLSTLIVICEIDFIRFVLTGLGIEPYFNARVFVACVNILVFGQVGNPFLIFISVSTNPPACKAEILYFFFRIVAISHEVQAANVIVAPLTTVVVVVL